MNLAACIGLPENIYIPFVSRESSPSVCGGETFPVVLRRPHRQYHIIWGKAHAVTLACVLLYGICNIYAIVVNIGQTLLSAWTDTCLTCMQACRKQHSGRCQAHSIKRNAWNQEQTANINRGQRLCFPTEVKKTPGDKRERERAHDSTKTMRGQVFYFLP